MTATDAPRGHLGLLVGLAVAIRVAYGFEYAALPFYWGPVFDSLVYERQAAAILDGRFGDPTLLAYSPLYGWFLAAFGPRPGLLPFVVQMALGVGTLVMIHRIAARLARDERAGDVAFALALGYGMLRFYETKLMSETLGLALLTGSLLATTRTRFLEGGARACLGAGALLGLAVLARASLLFTGLLTPLAALLPWTAGETPAARGRRGGFLALGFGAVLAANGAFHAANTGLFVPVILVSSTAATANAPESTGSFSDFAGDDGVVSVWDVVDQAEQTLDARRRGLAPSDEGARIDLGAYLRHLPMKLLRTLRDTETTHDYGYYGERTELSSWVLAPVSFGALLVLAALGLARAMRRDPRSLARLSPIVLGTLATTTLFHPTSRYRLPLAIALVLLAAPFVVALVDDVRAGTRRLLAGVLALACVALAVRHSTHRLRAPELWHLKVAESAFIATDMATYRERLARARAAAPGSEAVERTARALESSR